MCPVSKNESDAEEKRTGGKKSSPKRRTQGSPRKSGQSAGRSQSRSRSDRSKGQKANEQRDGRTEEANEQQKRPLGQKATNDKEQSGRPRRSGAPGDKRRFKSNDERSETGRTGRTEGERATEETTKINLGDQEEVAHRETKGASNQTTNGRPSERSDRSDRRRTSNRRDDKDQSGRPRRSGTRRQKALQINDERSNRPDRSDRHRSHDKRPNSYDSSEPEKKTKAPKVKKIRTEFGTRVARRITCTACGKSDTIDFVPQAGGAIVCRQCAYEKYNVHDPDQK